MPSQGVEQKPSETALFTALRRALAHLTSANADQAFERAVQAGVRTVYAPAAGRGACTHR